MLTNNRIENLKPGPMEVTKRMKYNPATGKKEPELRRLPALIVRKGKSEKGKYFMYDKANS